MSEVTTEESGVSSGPLQHRCQSGESLAEWRSLGQVENGSPSTSPFYWDSNDDDDGGPKPSDLYGKYTWKIDKFSQVNKRELRSNAFEVGGYKWYILIYPQGCDVPNHISLFLCVANHDKLLPGWSHFAQFTIAVVNKDPKKSKYSDTLHRFWKKEHDWGWKKFMELSKVSEGFNDADTLIIKAQVQVIRERADRPFRCLLDCQYRRELVRVYLTNVEQICRGFVEERRGQFVELVEDKAKWPSFCTFWTDMDPSLKCRMSCERKESILKLVVKHFFIEKEVTSTLVMDSLYSGLKALECQNKGKQSKGKFFEAEDLPVPIIGIEKDTFSLVDDVLLLLKRASMEPLPPKDEKGPQNRTKDGNAGEEFNKDSIERDERRLTELGRRTIEIFVLAHIFSKIEIAYREAVALEKQEELIREEEAAWLVEVEKKARRVITDKDKKSKKKQSKQKRNNRKGKDKTIQISTTQAKIEEDISAERKELASEQEIVLETSGGVEDISDVSDSVGCASEILPLDSEDRDTDTSEVHQPIEAGDSGISGLSSVVENGIETSTRVVNDNSSTCASDFVPSVACVVANKGKSSYHRNQKSPTRRSNNQSKLISKSPDWVLSQPVPDARRSNDASQSFRSQASVQSFPKKVVYGVEQKVAKKEEENRSFQRKLCSKGDDTNLLKPHSKITPLTSRINSEPNTDIPINQSDNSVILSSSVENAATSSTLDPHKLATSKPTEKPCTHQSQIGTKKLQPREVPVTIDKHSIPPPPVMSRPLSAPVVPPLRPAVSTGQTAPVLARSVSAAGCLGPEPTAYANQTYGPQSYQNAVSAGSVSGSSSACSQNHSVSSTVNASHLYSQMFSPRGSDRADPSPTNPNITFGMVSQHDFLHKGPTWTGHPNNMHSYDTYNPVYSMSSEFRPCTSGRQAHALSDEFPHLDIINDLLDDGHGIAMTAARVNSDYQGYGNGPHNMNRHYSFPGRPCMPDCLDPSSKFDRTGSYHDEGIQHGYGRSGRTYDTIPLPQVGPHTYLNGQVDGYLSGQWQMGGSKMPYLSAREVENGGGYPYHTTPEYSDLGGGINGYTVYRPSNGH